MLILLPLFPSVLPSSLLTAHVRAVVVASRHADDSRRRHYRLLHFGKSARRRKIAGKQFGAGICLAENRRHSSHGDAGEIHAASRDGGRIHENKMI